MRLLLLDTDVNILYDAQTFRIQRYGGISRYFAELAPRMAATSGVDARVLAPAHNNAYLAALQGRHVIGWRTPAWVHRVRGGRHVERRLSRALESLTLALRRTDILHETYYTETPLPARRAARVLTVYDMIHERFAHLFDPDDPTPRAKRAAIERADLVICISDSTRQDLIELLDVPPEKVVVTHLAASLSVPESGAPRDEEPYLLYVGERGGYKNFAALVAAMQASPVLRELRLLCFGGGYISDDEARRIAETGFPRSQIEQRFGGDAELAALYRGALCFVYPSLYEGFGIPPLEAMICGCPVACSNTSSIPEVVGDAAAYFDPDDVESIAAAVESVVARPSRRAELTALGKLQAARYSWDRCAHETLAAYRRIAQI